MARDRSDRVTPDLFELPPPTKLVPGSLDYSAELCGVLTAAMKASPCSRAEIAARMSDLTGKRISEDMLNAWSAPSKDGHRFPFEYAGAFEAACETTALQELLARRRGCRVLVGREVLDAELGRIARQRAELDEEEERYLSMQTRKR